MEAIGPDLASPELKSIVFECIAWVIVVFKIASLQVAPL